MKKVLLAAVLAVLSLGCAITDYPVITDTRGADDGGTLFGQYAWAYIRPYYGQVATIWSDGSDEIFSVVSQDWTGDQWLKSFNNFDASGLLNFLDQLYCDPTIQDANCPITIAWNPDLPNAYPHGDQSAGYNNEDDVFDYIYNPTCSGARSLSILISYGSRYYGECGSGFAQTLQNRAYEFSQLERAMFQGREMYHIPIDNSTASFTVTGQDGYVSDMRIFGRYNLYMDDNMRVAIPMSPNAAYQMRSLQNFVDEHGHYMNVNLTYGSLTGNFQISVTSLQGALDRL